MSDHEPDPGPQPPYFEERVAELERDTKILHQRIDTLALLVNEVVTLLKELRAAVQGEEA
jgi:hypothetical protein